MFQLPQSARGLEQNPWALKRENLESAPGPWLQERSRFSSSCRLGKTLREILASVVFDSFAQPAFAGARGGSGSRQFLLTAEEFDIHVRIWTLGNARRVTGQILSRGEAGSTGERPAPPVAGREANRYGPSG